MIDAHGMAGARRLAFDRIAEHDVEVPQRPHVDPGFRGGLLLDRVETLLRSQAGDRRTASGDIERGAPRHVVRPFRLVDAASA